MIGCQKTGECMVINPLRDIGPYLEEALVFIHIGVLGSLLGTRMGRQLSHDRLKKGFAGFLVVIGLYILTTNLLKILHPPPPIQGQLTSQPD